MELQARTEYITQCLLSGRERGVVVGEGVGVEVEEHFNQKEEMKKRMIAIFARDKDTAESFRCADFTPLHPLNAALRTSPGLGDTSAFFNSC